MQIFTNRRTKVTYIQEFPDAKSDDEFGCCIDLAVGYSAGRWEGDTFVVQSTGFDERTWVDHFGNPHSYEMRLEERYHRLDRDNLELVMTLTDPKTYTKPWVSERKVFKLAPANVEIQELFCVPSEEESFNQRVRDPAGGVIRK